VARALVLEPQVLLHDVVERTHVRKQRVGLKHHRHVALVGWQMRHVFATEKRFAGFTALPDLSLTVEPGTLVTLLGPSGCGKTTTRT
jgi:ABC-type Fe3+/spermidine/putrescine transport system ATPase subunit